MRLLLSVESHGVLSVCRRASSMQVEADAYGISSQAGILHRPQLLPQLAACISAQQHSNSSDSVLVTGGLGSIGRLTAAWQAAQATAPLNITLLGRSRHAGEPSVQLEDACYSWLGF